MAEWILSVSQLNEYVRRALAADPMLKGVQLRGEVSNWKRHSSGHVYFTLKDQDARIACVMFRSAAQSMSASVGDGMRVVLQGSVSLYAPGGQYQFYVDALRPDGVGELYMAYERLKARLEAEGLFDPSRKKSLPVLPRGVGIVTSPTGAVIRDIQEVARRRNPGIPLYLWPAKVQGDGAAQEVAAGIRALNKRPEVDVLIIGRGGGSLEELWAFNEEIVARAIAASEKPIVSAVGHETDFTIADFVADLRAPTPSAAAELTIPIREDLLSDVDALAYRCGTALRAKLGTLKREVLLRGQALDRFQPRRVLTEKRQRSLHAGTLMTLSLTHLLLAQKQRVQGLGDRLSALGPTQVLRRGYAYVTDETGHVLADAARARPGENIRVTLRDGALNATVRSMEGGRAHGGEKEA